MEENDDSLDRPTSILPSEDNAEVPRQIGPFRILEELGEGGMAKVYLAEQTEPVRRRVALKIIKPGMDSKQVIARFESERQALAVLDHPNIAKIYEGGVAPSGQPFFAMELVNGVPINEYCDDRRLTNRERIALFIDVCSAVQHAHHKGLIHRDLKPSNILVGILDNKPLVKVIDFGIAKATGAVLTDKTLYTRVGQLIGTPQYMSPEQADTSGVDIDTRSDIYSLGVILYELLVGMLPLELAEIADHAIQIALKERVPPKPSTRITQLDDTKEEFEKARCAKVSDIRRELSGDLDWVVMKTIEKDRRRRYGTANELAMECHRFLNHEPVLARAPSTGYLLRRFVRRNRVIVAWASVALIAIIAGAMTSTIQMLRAMKAEATAVAEAEAAEQARSELETVVQFLADMLSAADPGIVDKDVTVRTVLDNAAQSIAEDLNTQPVVEARLRGTIAETYEALGLYAEAETQQLRRLEIHEALHPDDDPGRLDAMSSLSWLKREQGHNEEAASLAEEVYALSQQSLGPNDPGTLKARISLANSYEELGRYEEAGAIFAAVLEVRREILGEEHEDTASSLADYGRFLWQMGDLETARVHLEQAFEIEKRLLGEENPDVLVTMGNLTAVLRQLGFLEEATESRRKMLEIQRENLGDEHPHTLITMTNLAVTLADQEQYDESVDLLNTVIATHSRIDGEEHPRTLYAMHNLGTIYTEQGELASAEETHRKSLAGMRRVLGEDNLWTMNAVGALASVLCRREKYGEAEILFTEFNETAPSAFPPDHPRVYSYRVSHTGCLVRQQSFDRAEQLLLAIMTETEQARGVNSPRSRFVIQRLVGLYDAWGKTNEAENYRQELALRDAAAEAAGSE